MIKVLLIDDDRKHSELLRAYLKQFGITLECAGDADEGLLKLARSEPDLLLLDVMLPGRDGFEICREIRKTSNIPIIMLTARGDVFDRISGLEIGADDYVAKPFRLAELVARIDAVTVDAARAAGAATAGAAGHAYTARAMVRTLEPVRGPSTNRMRAHAAPHTLARPVRHTTQPCTVRAP